MKHYCRVCGEEFSHGRAELGYSTCLEHGDSKYKFTVSIPYNKGPYQVISKKEIKDIGR